MNEDLHMAFLRVSPAVGAGTLALAVALAIAGYPTLTVNYLLCSCAAMLILPLVPYFARRSMRRGTATILLAACALGLAETVRSGASLQSTSVLALSALCALLLAVIVKPSLSYRLDQDVEQLTRDKIGALLAAKRGTKAWVLLSLIVLATIAFLIHRAYLFIAVRPSGLDAVSELFNLLIGALALATLAREHRSRRS